MGKKTRKQIMDKLLTIADWSDLGGVEVKHIEFGPDDYIWCISGAWTGKVSCHRAKIYYPSTTLKEPRPYIRIGSTKLYIDQFIRA